MSNNSTKQANRKAKRALIKEQRQNAANWDFYIPTYAEYIRICGLFNDSDMYFGVSSYTRNDNMSDNMYRIHSKALATIVAKTTDFKEVKFFNEFSACRTVNKKNAALVDKIQQCYLKELHGNLSLIRESAFFSDEMKAMWPFCKLVFNL